ncbi:hypothetical protein ACMXYW_14925 [Neptuniibacter sp. QD48_55]|uniref:hypothetical protein n=1 Tax=Neptuniibacter sp. QD48_55 TaxID=3398212 RepID=UPI0039F57F91
MKRKFKLQGSGKELSQAPETVIRHLNVDLSSVEKVDQAYLNDDEFWIQGEDGGTQTYSYKIASEAEAVDIYHAYISLQDLEIEYKKGHKWSLSRAMAVCALNGMPMPSWVAEAILDGYSDIRDMPSRNSWDYYLGSPISNGEFRKKYERDKEIISEIVFKVLLKLSKGKPIHTSTFEEISEELRLSPRKNTHIGTTKIKELFYLAQDRSFVLKYLIRKVKDKDPDLGIPNLADNSSKDGKSNIFPFFWAQAVNEFTTPSDIKVPDIDN